MYIYLYMNSEMVLSDRTFRSMYISMKARFDVIF